MLSSDICRWRDLVGDDDLLGYLIAGCGVVEDVGRRHHLLCSVHIDAVSGRGVLGTSLKLN
eukprot:6517458-Prorocentrum_lima.AAC.1